MIKTFSEYLDFLVEMRVNSIEDWTLIHVGSEQKFVWKNVCGLNYTAEFRVCAVSDRGQGPWSPAEAILVTGTNRKMTARRVEATDQFIPSILLFPDGEVTVDPYHHTNQLNDDLRKQEQKHQKGSRSIKLHQKRKAKAKQQIRNAAPPQRSQGELLFSKSVQLLRMDKFTQLIKLFDTLPPDIILEAMSCRNQRGDTLLLMAIEEDADKCLEVLLDTLDAIASTPSNDKPSSASTSDKIYWKEQVRRVLDLV